MSGSNEPVFIGLGANLPHAGRQGGETLVAALERLRALGVVGEACSSWYRTQPIPASDQPHYVNAVACVRTPLGPDRLMRLLHRVEAEFGRVRRVRNEARTLDLDLLAYGHRITAPETEAGPALPHPRLAERAFVLVPLAEIAPNWRHPVLNRTAKELLEGLPESERRQVVRMV